MNKRNWTQVWLFFVLMYIILPLNATIGITSTSGIWSNATSNGSTPTGFKGNGTSMINWGTPAESKQSGYGFKSLAPISNVALNSPIAIGQFTHYNYPIYGKALTAVQLTVSMLLNINGQSQNFVGQYQFLHDETPNIRPGCCNDIVTFANNTSHTNTITVKGVTYEVDLIGFETSLMGPLLSQFSTIENKTNTAYLFAEIRQIGVLAPEPATYLSLGSMLLVMGYFLRKRNCSIKEEL